MYFFYRFPCSSQHALSILASNTEARSVHECPADDKPSLYGNNKAHAARLWRWHATSLVVVALVMHI